MLMNAYLWVYLGSVFLAVAASPAVIWLARRIDALDRGGIRAAHDKPVPRIGGVAIFLAAMGTIVPVLFLNNRLGGAFRAVQLQLGGLLCMVTFVFLVGLVDDLRGLPARVKFAAETVAAVALCCVGVRISSLEITEGVVLNFAWLSCPLTVLWIVGVTNAVNLSDGLDGLAAGVSAVACATIAIFAIRGGDGVMAVFMLALLGGLSGFLLFNFNPARIFMGDCGSLFVGFTIASSSVMCLTKSAALVGLALPVLALGIPIFDTFCVMLRRFLERRSLFAADRGHFHHRLIDLGLKQRHAVMAVHGATCAAAGFGLFMMVRNDAGSLVIFGCILLLLILLFRVVGAVHFRQTIRQLQKKHSLTQKLREEKGAFEHVQLHFRQARTFAQWWSAVCVAAERLDFAWLSLTTTTPDGDIETYLWRAPGLNGKPLRILTTTMPAGNPGAPGQTKASSEFEVAVRINGSLESASHRTSLFARLIDEYDGTRLLDERRTFHRPILQETAVIESGWISAG